MTQPFIVQGRVYDARAFKRLLRERMTGKGEMRLSEIGELIGWSHEDDMRRLQKIVGRLAERVLERTSHGVYAVRKSREERGVDLTDETEESIIDTLRERGGIARLRTLARIYGVMPAGESGEMSNEPDYKRIQYICRTSDRIHQKLGERFFHLGDEELNGLPLVAELALRQIDLNFFETRRREPWPSDAQEIAYEKKYWLNHVGRAVRYHRDLAQIDITELAQRPSIQDAILDMKTFIDRRTLIGLESRVSNRIQALACARAGIELIDKPRYTAEDATGRMLAEYEAEEVARKDAHLLDLLEDGFVNAHLAATGTFWNALAAELKADPVLLTRGIPMSTRMLTAPAHLVQRWSDEVEFEPGEDADMKAASDQEVSAEHPKGIELQA